jgi:hypothetical protein
VIRATPLGRRFLNDLQALFLREVESTTAPTTVRVAVPSSAKVAP